MYSFIEPTRFLRSFFYVSVVIVTVEAQELLIN